MANVYRRGGGARGSRVAANEHKLGNLVRRRKGDTVSVFSSQFTCCYFYPHSRLNQSNMQSPTTLLLLLAVLILTLAHVAPSHQHTPTSATCPGTPNTNTPWSGQPVKMREVKNGSLYVVGDHGDQVYGRTVYYSLAGQTYRLHGKSIVWSSAYHVLVHSIHNYFCHIL